MTRPETEPPLLYADIPDTGKHLLEHLVEVHASSEGPNGANVLDPVERLIEGFEAVVEKKLGGGGGGGGDDGPPIDVKKFRKSNWWAQALIGVVIAASGAFAAYKATEARSVNNEVEVRKNKTAIKANANSIGEVKVTVDSTSAKIDQAMEGQRVLIDGINQLKAEAQTDKQKRLEDKVKALERENRRLERRHR